MAQRQEARHGAAPRLPLGHGRHGVLPNQWLDKAIDAGVVHSEFTIPDTDVQPASLDLRLGEVAYRLRCSFLPNGQLVEERLDELAMEQLSLIDGAILERNRPYLIPLMEKVALPPTLRARANPKSSTGRLDVFTRVIFERGYAFDDIPPGYVGPLYLEVVSRSYTIKVRRHLSLNQLRLVVGQPLLAPEQLLVVHQKTPVLFVEGEAVPAEKLVPRGAMFLSLDLAGGGNAGYRAKKNSQLLDVTAFKAHESAAFWEPLTAEAPGRLVLEPDDFYLLLSHEAVSIPPEYAAEMVPYDPTSGELRTHYAGFFDPGFGFGAHHASRGSRAALEVRAHDVPFMVEHGQYVCRLNFEVMYEAPTLLYGDEIGSNYQAQQLALSKHFR